MAESAEDFLETAVALEEVTRSLDRVRNALIDLGWSEHGAEQASMFVMQNALAVYASEKPRKRFGRQ